MLATGGRIRLWLTVVTLSGGGSSPRASVVVKGCVQPSSAVRSHRSQAASITARQSRVSIIVMPCLMKPELGWFSEPPPLAGLLGYRQATQ